MTDLPKIPDSVLALLRYRWHMPQTLDHFGMAFTDDPRDADRKTHPPYYWLENWHKVDGWDPFSYKEAIALMKDGVFGNMAVDYGHHVGINEHASHALQDLCEDVYAAWAKYLDRIKLVERSCPHPEVQFSERE